MKVGEQMAIIYINIDAKEAGKRRVRARLFFD